MPRKLTLMWLNAINYVQINVSTNGSKANWKFTLEASEKNTNKVELERNRLMLIRQEGWKRNNTMSGSQKEETSFWWK